MNKSEATPDLVAQLRETRRMNVPYQLMMDAANEIERLRAEVARLEAQWWKENIDDTGDHD